MAARFDVNKHALKLRVAGTVIENENETKSKKYAKISIRELITFMFYIGENYAC
jgi:hypothetical protein